MMKEGYKKTDVGVIPEEWEVKRINELLIESYLGGNYKNTLEKNFEKNTLPLIKMGNIGRGKICTDTYYSIETKEELNEKHLLYFNDILFNTRNTLDLVGKVAIWKSEYDKAYFNSNLLKLVFDKSKIISSDFINYQLNSYNTLRKLKAVATGTTSVAAIYDKDLKKIQLPIPPLPEQKAIADCLTTWDSGIEKLSALIKAKKEQKKGLMQQLLTGEKRLDGFEGEWKKVLLGNIAHITTGSSNKQDAGHKYTYTFFDRSSDILTSKIYLYDCEAIIVPGEGADFMPKYFVGKFDLHQRAYAIMDYKGASGKFIFYYLLNDRKHLHSQAVGSTVRSLRLPYFKNMPLVLPSLKEQTAIANVLTTADKEITLLEKKLEGFKEQKRGLMQVLLTGERRLIN